MVINTMRKLSYLLVKQDNEEVKLSFFNVTTIIIM